ncbi:MAG: polysaccharide biosynthesis protein [Desulfonatronovibrionaceae bacterium]
MNTIRSQLANPKFYIMLLSDALLVAAALMFAYLLRFDFVPGRYMHQALVLVPFAVTAKAFFFFVFGLYRGMWRYTSLEDLVRLFLASLLGETLLIAGIAYLFRFYGFPRSVFGIDFFLTLFLCGGLRVAIRSYFAWRRGALVPSSLRMPFMPASRGGQPVLIVGAGNAGEKVCREILERKDTGLSLVGFVDDDPDKINRLIHGIPVLGAVHELLDICASYQIREVFIALPSASGQKIRLIVETCEAAGVRYKILPGIGELMEGKVSVKHLRDVNYTDLLGRPEVELDDREIAAYIAGKTILVSGAGGSIGSELCRQILQFNPGHIVLLDSSEAKLYSIQMELWHERSFHELTPVLGQCQDKDLVEDVFARIKPEVVFHAAAYKHVPLLEENPWQAVENNIRGTFVLMQAAWDAEVERFVVVSTDKAVRPTNVMGASKRVTELLMHAFPGGGTRFMAVRFGNVLGSSGSVVPLFRRQIEHGGPVTVTHPEVTRYFMTVEEATQLILQAGSMGRGGEIFILKMGVPIKIADMARDLIRLSGKEPERDIDIVFTGLRPGEKLYEELITEGEGIVQTMHEKIMVLESEKDSLVRGDGFQEKMCRAVSDLEDCARARDKKTIQAKFLEVVPEYRPGGEE